MNRRPPSRELQEQYRLEKELAMRLRTASADERRHLYSQVYDEFFRCIPVAERGSERRDVLSHQLRMLRPFLRGDSAFLEVGAGDCAVSLAVARVVKKVHAVEVSAEVTRNLRSPPNFELMASDAFTIPLPPNSVDVAYSNQVMEHLHPDDALRQLQDIYRVLVPGGIYICVTPNPLSGPHDISKYFDATASGLHLHEYTTTELQGLFRAVGFVNLRAGVSARGWCAWGPVLPFTVYEAVLEMLPGSIGRLLARQRPFRNLLAVGLAAKK